MNLETVPAEVVVPPTPVEEIDFSQELVKDLQLADFLSRPVMVYSGSWAENTTFSTSLDPFKLLLANTAIKNKLNGYRYFRAGMKLTITISSSPFLYSALQVSYAPLESGADTYGFRTMFGTSDLDVLARSNLPMSGWVYPQDGKPLVIDVPFICPIDWYNVTSSNPAGFGVLRLGSAISLRSAGTASISTCTVTVLAQFVDPEICGLTASAPQSNTMAGASKDLSKAGFGSASAWAKVASKALKLVGLSNPAEAVEAHPTVPKLFPYLTNTDMPVFAESMALGKSTGLLSDPHNSPGDELDIATICARTSTIMMAPWTTTNVVGDSIFRAYVTPCQMLTEMLAGPLGKFYERMSMTHACYLSTFFTKWRGTVCYRFKPICSQFHRGKLRIFYDSGSLVSPPAEGVLTSQIIDLAEVGDCVIRIPMNTASPWLSVLPWLAGGYPGFDSPVTFAPLTINSSYAASMFNGSIRVQVMQALTSPNAIGNVVLQVETWFEDAQFADPTHWTVTGAGALTVIDPSPWQSGEDDDGVVVYPLTKLPKLTGVTLVPRDGEQAFDDNLGLGTKECSSDPPGVISKGRATSMVIGEDIISMRVLAHRSSYYKPIGARKDQSDPVFVSGDPGTISTTIPRMPRFFGMELKTNMLDVSHRALTTIGGNKIAFNYVNEPAFLRLAAMFLGYKGSIRWRFASTATGGLQGYPNAIWVSRSNFPPGREVIPTVQPSSSFLAYNRLNFVADSGSGLAVANLNYMGATVDFPDYNVVKFMPVNPFLDLDGTWYQAMTANRSGETDNFTLCTQIPFSSQAVQYSPSSSIDTYVSACPDMRFFHYRGPPLVYRTFQKPSPTPSDEN